MTRQQFETALDAGKLEVQLTNGRWYRVRRNGKTKTWKTRPGEFETPIKWCLRNCGRVSDMSIDSPELRIVE